MNLLVDNIKNIAHKASEDYLLTDVDMNDTILSSYYSGDISNLEILKRICELSNQNVYLSLFQSEDTDKTNVSFVLADFNKLKTEILKSEKAMENYATPPSDFRSLLTLIVGPNAGNIEQAPNDGEKLAEFQKVGNYKNAFAAFASGIETLRYSEVQNAEKAFLKIAHDTKLMVSSGESIGDIAKVASRFVKDEGFDPMKIATAYDVIHRDLVRDGFTVKTVFTKTSSLRVNKNSDMLKPVNEFIMSLEKIAATTEMLHNLNNTLAAFNKVLNGELVAQKN